jgi:threonine/homoserine/homoserine lactone efflux protein
MTTTLADREGVKTSPSAMVALSAVGSAAFIMCVVVGLLEVDISAWLEWNSIERLALIHFAALLVGLAIYAKIIITRPYAYCCEH